ncbi:MAG TPA: acyl-CoA transferase [Rhodobacteraceae bacterium]|nr:acyl-CoA transferase [Paracoccaceae bacterium]
MDEVFASLGLTPDFQTVGEGSLPSRFAVTALAVAAYAAVGQAMAGLLAAQGLAQRPKVQVNRALASRWYGRSIQPIGWELPPLWDAVAGLYRCKTGWIRLHTNLAHHHTAALSVLNAAPNREAVAQAALSWRAEELETAITQAGGVAAMMRTAEEWVVHPQGLVAAQEPLIGWVSPRNSTPQSWDATLARPLNGLKVLDLTRVLAGPVATRTLAGFGAQVLRIDPPEWEEPNVIPDVTLGKRCARLDLTQPNDRATFEALLSKADILVHGYRSGALEGLGYGLAERQALNPTLIEASLNAYGWTGPWAGKRGFDSLVQMACGIADAGMHWAKADGPTPLPVQALDHATGYLMAAAILKSLTEATGGKLRNARLSLARTAQLLMQNQQSAQGALTLQPENSDFNADIETTPWGPARRLAPALQIEGCPMRWKTPAAELGSSAASWA